MYDELHDIWKKELESVDLVKLAPDFYSRLAQYLRKLKEESRMLDKRTVKAKLLRNEAKNAKHMLRELIWARYRKLVRSATAGNRISSDVLAAEEEKLLIGILPLAEAYEAFAKSLLQGRMLESSVEKKSGNCVLRFLGDVPAVIGSDMKTYGPFKIEDIASLPFENAKILVKQGLAEEIETG